MKNARSIAKGKTRVKAAGRPLQLSPKVASFAPRNPPITLLTDFGDSDHFVGAMKGIIVSVNPRARVIDISHQIPPQDLEAGAFILLAGYQSFPAGTIHLAVVDPGVGSARRPILVRAGNYSFVGPDNGIFSYIYEREESFKAFHLTNDRYFRQPVSKTFHGRDIFAPVAAVLSLGIDPIKLGREIRDPVRLKPLQPQPSEKGKLKGRILHIDHFGNCVTNIREEDFRNPTKLELSGKTIRAFKQFFADKGNDKLFGLWGSSGFLEIAANNASAARLLGAKRGDPVFLS